MGVSGSGRQTPFIPYWLRPLYAAALSPLQPVSGRFTAVDRVAGGQIAQYHW